MRSRRGFEVMLLLVGALAVQGCTLLPILLDPLTQNDRKDEFERALAGYGDDVRWGRLREALQRVEPGAREDFLMLLGSSSRPLRFTAFEIVNIEPDPDWKSAVVLASYELQDSSMRERRVQERQVWSWSANGGWYVEPDLAAFDLTER